MLVLRRSVLVAHTSNTRARMCQAHMIHRNNQSLGEADGIVEQGKAFTSVLLGKSIPKGNSRITSVTLKLGDSPGGVPCNKWAVVVCKKLKNSSRGFRLISRAEIIVDESKLMENQTVKLEHVLSVDKVDFVGVSNPYGKLGLSALERIQLREKHFLLLRVCLGDSKAAAWT